MSGKVVKHPAIPESRRWEAGQYSLLNSSWTMGSAPIDVDIRHNLRALRARSRDAAQNLDYVRAFLRELKTNVIGPNGIQLQSRVRLRSGRPDQGARTAIEEAWREWGMPGVCEVTGKLDWIDVQRLAVETMARDGEILVRMVGGWDNESRLALQLIDPELLDVQYSETSPGDNVIQMGVELDEWRRPVAYHLLPDAAGLHSYPTYRNSDRVRVPANEIIHLHLPEWISQTRGVPWTATALTRLHHLGGYEDAAVVAARGGASKMNFYKRDVEAPATVDDGDEAGPGGLADGRTSGGELFQNFQPGAQTVLPPGWDIAPFDPAFPNADHAPFMSAMLRGVASGLGVSYHTLAQDLESVNYSSLRHSALAERAVWQLLQQFVSRHLCRPVYEQWLASSLLLGVIRRPSGRPLPAGNEREFRRVMWQPRGWAWVDPEKEMKAAQREVGMRLQSISGLMRERGRDPDQIWEELAEDRRRLSELELAPEDVFESTTQDDDDE